MSDIPNRLYGRAKYPTIAISLAGLWSCTSIESVVDVPLTPIDFAEEGTYETQYETRNWVDPDRADRPVTTHIWYPADPKIILRGAVIFSHGAGANGGMHHFIGEHLASHGYVMAAPDHFGQTTGQDERPDVLLHRPYDLQYAIAKLADDGFREAIDAGVSVVGHSIGGYSALSLCGAAVQPDVAETDCDATHPSCVLRTSTDDWQKYSDRRAQTCIGLTPWVEPVFGRDGRGAANLDRPILLLGATEDEFLPLAPELRNFFSHAPQPKSVMLEIDGAAHLSFTDFLHEGSLPHDTVKEIVRRYLLAWLELQLHDNAAARTVFTQVAVAETTQTDVLALHGTP